MSAAGDTARPADRGTADNVAGLPVSIVILSRELLRFIRQPARIVAAVGTPLLIWLLFAGGLANSLGAMGGGSGYGVFLLPGVMTLVAIFASIFSSISVIDDRKEGWLQAVLVSPAPRWSIASGKIAGGALAAGVQASLLLLVLPVVHEWPGVMGAALAVSALLLTSIAMTSIGLAFAWRSETAQGFHAVMNLVLMPMWLLSGAFFSVRDAAVWLAWPARLNPLSWCTEAIRSSIAGEPDWIAFGVSAVFAAGATAIAFGLVARAARG